MLTSKEYIKRYRKLILKMNDHRDSMVESAKPGELKTIMIEGNALKEAIKIYRLGEEMLSDAQSKAAAILATGITTEDLIEELEAGFSRFEAAIDKVLNTCAT